MEIKPDRTNWKRFCKEPQLTEVEQKAWNELASAIQQNDVLYDFINAETEWAAFQQERLRTDDWSDLVEWADANRALQRAEIKAYQEWRKS